MTRAKHSPNSDVVPLHKSDTSLLSEFFNERPRGGRADLWRVELRDTTAGPKILALDRRAQAELVAEMVARLTAPFDDPCWAGITRRQRDHQRMLCLLAVRSLLRRKLPLSEAVLLRLLNWVAGYRERYEFYEVPLIGIGAAIANLAVENDLDGPIRDAVGRVADRLAAFPSDPTCRKVADQLKSLVDGEPAVRLEPGEAWSDAALADLAAMDADRRRAWTALLTSCQVAGHGKLTARWARAVRPLIEAVGRDDFRACLCRWFALVNRRPSVRIPRESVWEPDWDNYIRPAHVELLKGLAWCAGFEADHDLACALHALARSAYRKIREKGARLPGLGNAAVAALGAMPGGEGISQLKALRRRANSIPARNEIEKALAAAGEREAPAREDAEFSTTFLDLAP